MSPISFEPSKREDKELAESLWATKGKKPNPARMALIRKSPVERERRKEISIDSYRYRNPEGDPISR
jgi:hypothetical protein